MKLSDFAESDGMNDRLIQMALREVDSTILSEAMVGLPQEEREIILRNMSKRASALLTEDIADAEARVSEQASESALDFFLQKLSKYQRYTKGRPNTAPITLPTIDVSSDSAIVESFVALSRFVRVRGWTQAQGVEEGVTDPVARKGLELSIDGWDPMLARQILERTVRTEMRQIERRYEMIVEALDSIASGDAPIATEERLRAFLER